MRRIFLLMLFCAVSFFIWPVDAALFSNLNALDKIFEAKLAVLSVRAPRLNKNVLRLALRAYYRARAMGLDNKELLTVVDYTQPEVLPRLYVFNLRDDHVEYNTLVAHGKNSGGMVPWRFSNSFGSDESSIGVFRTGSVYLGHNGPSLELDGLEPGFNSNARSRRIVMHGAWYVSERIAAHFHAIGRSWGCLAMPQAVASSVMDRIKEGTIIFAYYPSRLWLATSRFVT